MRLPALFGTVLGASILLTPAGVAQTCTAALVATWAPTASTLSVTLNGAPANSPTMTFASLHSGTTTMHGITLGLGSPFYLMFAGVTDANGHLAFSSTLTSPPTGVTAYFQSATVVMTGGPGHGGMSGGGHGGMSGPGPGGMLFCLSNVAAVQFP